MKDSFIDLGESFLMVMALSLRKKFLLIEFILNDFSIV